MAGAQAHVFRHNQPKHLERLIASHGPGLILVDSVYSADGSVCPLTEVSAVSERLGCILVVDESHAIGVYGPHGEGLVHTLGLTSKAHYRTFSLSKAFATRAGYERAQRLGRALQRPVVRDGWMTHFPPGPLAAWGRSRDLPALPPQTFREWWESRGDRA